MARDYRDNPNHQAKPVRPNGSRPSGFAASPGGKTAVFAREDNTKELAVRKIQSLFQRNFDGDRRVRDEVAPGAEWVIAGEGVATRKWDGTCCMIRGGRLYKRYEVKPGGKPPADFEPANEVDESTGKQQGWLPCGEGPEDCWHREAWETFSPRDIHGNPLPHASPTYLSDATYELCGPKIQGNPEKLPTHMLIKHGDWLLRDCPRDFVAIREYLSHKDIEGIVWCHPDGRMVKIKAKDFGIKRPLIDERYPIHGAIFRDGTWLLLTWDINGAVLSRNLVYNRGITGDKTTTGENDERLGLL